LITGRLEHRLPPLRAFSHLTLMPAFTFAAALALDPVYACTRLLCVLCVCMCCVCCVCACYASCVCVCVCVCVCD
jgi:hypothetical protein